MSGTKHTPGPWRVDTEVRGLPNWVDVIGPRIRVGSPTIATDITYEEGQRRIADARLIAAAPELLEACIAFVEKCDAGRARSVASYNQMNAAIAKATGGGQ